MKAVRRGKPTKERGAMKRPARNNNQISLESHQTDMKDTKGRKDAWKKKVGKGTVTGRTFDDRQGHACPAPDVGGWPEQGGGAKNNNNKENRKKWREREKEYEWVREGATE